jgi:hypothetical protein
MDPPLLRFESSSTEYGHDGTVLNLVVDVISALTSPGAGPGGGGSGKSVRRYPEVAVYNAAGQRRVLDVTDTAEEARDRASTIENDFETMEIQEWCERYSVPLSFITEVSQ